MGLGGWFKDQIKGHVAKRAGRDFAKGEGKVRKVFEFLKRNQAKVGAIFAAVGTWGVVQGCPPVLGVDLVQATGIACETANQGIFLVGFFLLGAGLITSDQHAAVIQGRRAPAGPPETVPGPKSSDLRG